MCPWHRSRLLALLTVGLFRLHFLLLPSAEVSPPRCLGVDVLDIGEHKEANDQEHHCAQDLGQSPGFSLFWRSIAHFVSRNWVVVSSGIGGCVGFLLLLS